ncbi:hypothetical protein BZA70DRAFT_278858 [Myxozyma melibiosi]|uniref:Glc8 protein n=1 Tax=Myxozyma melibiosi TaxID=54550 RepID=A0ABR1F593_9ASCO
MSHTPVSADTVHPRGILKNPPPPERYHQPPPPIDRDLLLQNTERNAAMHGDRSMMNIKPLEKKPAAVDPLADRGHTSGAPLVHAPHSEPPEELLPVEGEDEETARKRQEARLKWDEANIYLTEQERTATMKITEPKTPYAASVDPSDLVDYDDNDEIINLTLNGINNGVGAKPSSDVPDLDLGEPEENYAAVPSEESRIIVDESAAAADEREEQANDENTEPTETEEERHRRFEELRKKHYEMKDALKIAQALAKHPEDEEDEDEE